jgi:hypothetical protein
MAIRDLINLKNFRGKFVRIQNLLFLFENENGTTERKTFFQTSMLKLHLLLYETVTHDMIKVIQSDCVHGGVCRFMLDHLLFSR